MSNDPRCMVCGVSVEDASDVLRECVKINVIWSQLIKPDKVWEFFNIDMQSWIRKNLHDPTYVPIQSGNWDLLFDFLLWNTWLWRNQCIFNSGECINDRLISQSYQIQDEARRAMNMRLLPDRIPPSEPIAHHRCKLALGWIKVNTDGAQNPCSGESFCGGVGGDDNMRWCFGFSKKIGICSTFDAELGEVYEGLG
ncbi:hypothetical protein GQ457_04G013840 [Hibiscus cannabinus]